MAVLRHLFGAPWRRPRTAAAHATRLAILTAVVVLPSGCAGGGRSLHPDPEPVAYADTLPIPEPERFEPLEAGYLVEDAVSGEVARGISLRRALGRSHESLNVTRFDDVVGSAWFEHRNGAAKLTPEEVSRGSTTDSGPDTTGAILLTQAKLQGISPGFHIEDARGARYVVKFDPRGFQYLSSSAGVIANRLFHAAGYHVPEDHIFRFRREHITGVKEGATYQDEEFEEHPLGLDLVDEILSRVDTLPDGRFLAVASRYVPGPPKGPFHFEGRRKDDPNDHYRHEHRRELRGLYVVSSWLNHVDMRFMNTMDAYVEPGYLRHYLIDFAASLGSGTIRPHQPREGAEYNFDFWPTMGRVFSLGFYRQGWEDRDPGVIDPSIGWLQVEEFDPGAWKANWPNAAFRNMTLRDAYWGAKLVGSFTDEQIRSAVSAGELPTRNAADTLASILIYRRDRIVEHWYSLVSPLENVDTELGSRSLEGQPSSGLAVSFDDAGIRDGAWRAGEVFYEWSFAHPGQPRPWTGRVDARDGSGRQRVEIAPGPGQDSGRGSEAMPSGGDAIAVLRLTVVRRGGEARGRPATVYLAATDGAPGFRVVGLEH